MKKIRVLIVDDSAVLRNIYTKFLSEDPQIEVVGAAEDPYDARDKIKLLDPDVITLDIQMPRMDGLTFLEKIMTFHPLPVIMVSTLTEKDASTTIKALELGAVDYVHKPSTFGGSGSVDVFRTELIEKVKIAAQAEVKFKKVNALNSVETGVNFSPCNKMVAIGSSTGGVEALSKIIPQLPKNAPAILVVQHMPEHFTLSFAKRLNELADVTVLIAADKMPIETGHVYIAPGNSHMKIIERENAGYAIALDDNPVVNGFRPSVDVLFNSFADLVPQKTVAFILTGMGTDGALGCKAIYDNGGKTYGQSKESCLIYGMPKAASECNGIIEEIDLNQIVIKIMQ
jgi:two-component system chemotaxis response regulator CheB